MKGEDVEGGLGLSDPTLHYMGPLQQGWKGREKRPKADKWLFGFCEEMLHWPPPPRTSPKSLPTQSTYCNSISTQTTSLQLMTSELLGP